MNHEELWKAALGEIELAISKAQFNTWFNNTSILSIKDGEILICVANGFAKEWLENKYNIIILRALNNNNQNIRTVKCQVGSFSQGQQKRVQGIDAIQAPHDQKKPAIQLNSNLATKIPTPPFASKNHAHNLNPRYTFESFIIGENNELARAACLAISQSLGTLYNPLFIYGGVGLGKTHLLQSIGNEVLKQDSKKRVLYTTSEKFTSKLIASIKNKEIDAFKLQYQEIDLLIIDDVQFLSGKEKTQHEFFNIFNALYQVDKQIVISSDRPPSSIPTLEDRLRSRFEGGMITDIGRPDFETRVAILKEKIQQKNTILPEDVIHYIAENVTKNIRELEGALNKIIALSQFGISKETSVDTAKKALEEIISNAKQKSIQPEKVIQAVCEFYNVEITSLVQKTRKKEIAHPRQVAMFFLRTELSLSYSGIGGHFGGRDHTTVMHACEKINKEMRKNTKLEKEIETVKEKMYTY